MQKTSIYIIVFFTMITNIIFMLLFFKTHHKEDIEFIVFLEKSFYRKKISYFANVIKYNTSNKRDKFFLR